MKKPVRSRVNSLSLPCCKKSQVKSHYAFRRRGTKPAEESVFLFSAVAILGSQLPKYGCVARSIQVLIGRKFQVMFCPVRRIVSIDPRIGESRYEYFVPVNAFSLVTSHDLAVFFRDAVVYPFPFAKLRTRKERAASEICPHGRG
jgi:hypothetical protein